ncbi:hypothetical protein GW17_00019577 [Ensete ventricosum]|nr:hypothetical protein GW17_00019577 [Ensete ventricosum]
MLIPPHVSVQRGDHTFGDGGADAAAAAVAVASTRFISPRKHCLIECSFCTPSEGLVKAKPSHGTDKMTESPGKLDSDCMGGM